MGKSLSEHRSGKTRKRETRREKRHDGLRAVRRYELRAERMTARRELRTGDWA
jgi:hypothetical protein